jgi:putative addiction module component (TIGR02574 family)
MTREAILQEALRLPPKERADVAAELLDSLESEPTERREDVEMAWADEIERRARRVISGEATGSSWEEVRERLERRLPSP